MENKYYTPEISEFHVGFEYEYQEFDSNKWKKDVFKTGQSPYGEEQRVKYLDQEDIESLEWIKHATLENLYFKESQEQNLYGTTYLNINNFGKELLIEDDRTGDYLFKGTIKNKSELKRLMQQLNIK